jgi:hypothetical protein
MITHETSQITICRLLTTPSFLESCWRGAEQNDVLLPSISGSDHDPGISRMMLSEDTEAQVAEVKIS